MFWQPYPGFVAKGPVGASLKEMLHYVLWLVQVLVAVLDWERWLDGRY